MCVVGEKHCWKFDIWDSNLDEEMGAFAPIVVFNNWDTDLLRFLSSVEAYRMVRVFEGLFAVQN